MHKGKAISRYGFRLIASDVPVVGSEMKELLSNPGFNTHSIVAPYSPDYNSHSLSSLSLETD